MAQSGYEEVYIETTRELPVFERRDTTDAGLLQLSLPNLSTLSCYDAKDDLTPLSRLVFQLPDISLLAQFDEQAQSRFGGTSTAWEQSVLEASVSPARKIYRNVSATGQSASLAPIHLAVSTRIDEADDESFNEWYESEHVVMMGKIPGWVRTRRFKRLRAYGEDLPAGQTEYLAIYEFQAENGLQGPIHKAASATPGTANVRAMLRWKENRTWKHLATVDLRGQ
ncbi:hypothetical protein CLAFUW4_01859 [Fulvia fulva]|uniref:Uncharacterized protein n=1 Tax=Passalora fulva TaxID=5499 RepID=A0A9Q8P2S0_PASFU|nr:uncharacterized protein CLAFUR5_01854 [Fulvia fulva]KAK4635687.1 hypothetical protein CLAFUR4_01854 [Fulvia fulva]KAK4636814.1 hypothetical protein CLAFUR0_01856 [Fulvia fulva]UJO10996.1 hypothetical protein CLAFUR5_01854 [Fulvia fulva]WPV08777.1 hypothetical protein CLAFUW4_01859 [Fulvia fulva]WPV24107.1 hypothetical protein CLAFUW7_01858 [Fulvia fulva]